MQVVVLNGANLNAIGDRDPALYGGLGYAELETQIYAWGKELGCSVRCFQTNHEGQFIDWCHDARRWADGVIVNPGAWTHYSYAIRDALELFSVPVAQVPLVGRTEREVAWLLEQALHEEGADGLAFDVTVASGPNAALPHHHTGERRIGAGETVVADAGAKIDGYCSDCTRTFATGPLPEDLRRAYAVCRSAQERALAEVRSGAAARGLDGIARRELEEAGYDVLHGLGHGVGLEVHELPVMRPTAEGTLEPGNVVTVEPGTYLAGRGGVRLQDLVIVTEDGAEVLTPFTKELLTLD